MDNDINTIMLTDEDGVEQEFEVVVKFDIEEKEYVILTPMDAEEDEEEDDAIAFRIDRDENGNDVLVNIEDEEEFEMVNEAYEALFSDYDLN